MEAGIQALPADATARRGVSVPPRSLNTSIGTLAVLDRVSGFNCPYDAGRGAIRPEMVVVEEPESARHVEGPSPGAQRLRDRDHVAVDIGDHEAARAAADAFRASADLV